MSEISRIQFRENFEDIQLVTEVCRDLRNQGLIQCWFPGETRSVATNYYKNRNPHNRVIDKRMAARMGEQLAVVLNNTYGDVAGLALHETKNGPRGEFIGGVHIENGTRIQEQLEKTLFVIRREYRIRQSLQAAQTIAENYGGSYEREDLLDGTVTKIRINISGTSF